jgi:dihydrofolate reductase
MGKLIYIANVSLDGYTEDETGDFTWSAPEDDAFVFITDLIRPVCTHLYGRRMYETMAVWETDPALAAESELMAEFARIWQDADKVVYSTTLDQVSTARTELRRALDADAVRQLKESAAGDLTIGGPNLGGQALSAGLVDEVQLFVRPLAVGGGKPALPRGVRVELELLDERRLDGGVVYLRYGVHR